MTEKAAESTLGSPVARYRAVDVRWAIAELTEFQRLTVEWIVPPTAESFPPPKRITGTAEQIAAAAHVVEQILDRVLPSWRSLPEADIERRWDKHREAAQRAIAQLTRREELQNRLGDNAPQLDASHLHPWVWQGARSLWHSGHYRGAVRAAAVKVNAETQNKLGRRNLTETDLLVQALSDDPPKPGAPRLRLAEESAAGDKTVRSLRRGVRAYAEGCFAAIRNPASHESGNELPEDEALEQLAAFSVLARWIDRAELQQ